MTVTSDTLLGLAWYTFATCCSRRCLFPLLSNSEVKVMVCITVFFKVCTCNNVLELVCNNFYACDAKLVVVISLDSPSCGVCLLDPRTGGCIGTLPDRPRIVPFDVRLCRCCLYGDGQHT